MEEETYTIVEHGPYRGIIRYNPEEIVYIPKCTLNQDGSLNREFRFSSSVKKEEEEEEEMPGLAPLIEITTNNNKK